MRKSCHKYGLEIVTSIEHAKKLEQVNINTLRQDTPKLEMSNVEMAFNILKDNARVPSGYRKSSGHMIWGLKIDLPARKYE